MKIPTDQCLVLYSFILGESTKEELENWIYATPKLETYLGADDYLDLISVDFHDAGASHYIGKILSNHISVADYLTWRIKLLMKRIIARPADVHIHIEETYNLYCKGYDFLQKIGMEFGLSVASPPCDYTKEWGAISRDEQIALIESLYPNIIKHAERVLDLLDEQTIEFLEMKDVNLLEGVPSYPEYIDRRDKPTTPHSKA
ncbi:MAG: hypothetical protein ACPGVT_12910 [Maricaulaceae bacterium]